MNQLTVRSTNPAVFNSLQKLQIRREHVFEALHCSIVRAQNWASQILALPNAKREQSARQ
jgi:hypothetical protein